MEQINSSILLIDDHPMLRNGVKQLINTVNHFEIVGEAGSGIEGVKLAQELDPDIILLDINMQDVNGLEILRYLREKNIASRIIMFTVSDAKEDIITALKTGADGYLLKDMEPEDFLKSLKEISLGKLIMDDAISHIILNYMRHGEEQLTNQTHDVSLLTPRENEIFNLLVQGLPNKLIAKELGIVESTVKVHIKSIFKKLNFKSRMEMTVWYLQSKE
ncbi:two-component system response regulator NarL [Gilliamella sp. Fer1-1]|jgi:two-component system, NarL family, nitrate/nitrite response regulator NarL|uniref:two-component system response regulator NarL n=1 Tax=unclassified Gilliamella TaxID=2685620 RepID=UPI00080DC888|nr:two-component system response regulator NarL [Gilliamella apicola]OCG16620.1 two-component system response regulator NarL [Gilliamella apicola]OCG23424.1 two-component system response regulator NarL [Gilliamella apicola]OCG29607.1 two-component system response regulator NarL [Gilliamella apicola]OCG32246.1 two-component system response regulator NarL [Gilliamella apicola]OCG44749.1 two-component system response regulator NarL [Gilliamella apicola]